MKPHMTLAQAMPILLLCLILLITSGCKKSSTEPQPIVNDQSALLVSSLSIALVQGANEIIVVNARNKNDEPEAFQAVCSDAQIATLMCTDSTVCVTGLVNGSTKITLTSNSGKKKEIPVSMYWKLRNCLSHFLRRFSIAGAIVAADKAWMALITIRLPAMGLNHWDHLALPGITTLTEFMP